VNLFDGRRGGAGDQGTISIRSLEKRHGRDGRLVRALAGITLEIPFGQFVAIMGPSGSGKSTLLHLLGGLDRPTSGEIVIGDRNVGEMSDDEITTFRRRKIGFVFQFFNLLPTLTAVENVGLPLLIDGMPSPVVQKRAAAALAQVGLGHRGHHRPEELSGGEMQRVAIARALVIDPIIILADEPTGNLDSTMGEEVLDLLRNTHRERRATLVMVTHEARAAGYAERKITVHDGQVVHDTAVAVTAGRTG